MPAWIEGCGGAGILIILAKELRLIAMVIENDVALVMIAIPVSFNR